MFPTIQTTTETMTLDDLVGRLTSHANLDGIVVMGSASSGLLNPASDYDLYVVLSSMPEPMFLLLTTVEHRLTEVYFTTAEAIDQMLAVEHPTAGNQNQALATQWLQTGRIAFDRYGRLDLLRRKVQEPPWRDTAYAHETSQSDMYAYWWKINYNLRQTRRMLVSTDPAYLIAVDIRLLYSLPEVFVGYARIRGMPWRGEKELIRYLMQHDQPFLDLFLQCIAETDYKRKAALYEQIAALALAPLGGLWAPGATAVQIATDPAFAPGNVERALRFWQNLLDT